MAFLFDQMLLVKASTAMKTSINYSGFFQFNYDLGRLLNFGCLVAKSLN
jgi:hypothetical protein